MVFNVFDKNGNYLGTIEAGTAENALIRAKCCGMNDATHVELRVEEDEAIES